VYQLYVTDLHPDGAGAVYVAAEQVREKLRKSGIFDQSHKRPLPPLPEKIGAVTSSEGAALQDIINILSRRYPIGQLSVFPVQVQGSGAEEEICRGLARAQQNGCDVIIVGRGGGSIEDLNAFNSEKVAMAVYNCAVPVVSAVGHETDFTVTDLAADMRAPTPSAAAELVAPSAEQLMGNVEYIRKRLFLAAEKYIQQRFSETERLQQRLLRFSPEHRLFAGEQRLETLLERMHSAFKNLISLREKQFVSAASRLEAMSPVSVMCRGYSLVYGENGKIISDSTQLHEGETVNIRLNRGSVKAQITERTVEE
jgi:exodeoxyribonuclease VII large subunit